jgi:hypothetical protein
MGKFCFGKVLMGENKSGVVNALSAICLMVVLVAPFAAMVWQNHKWTENREKESRKAFSSARYNVGDVVTLKPDNVQVVVVNQLYHFDSKSLTYSVKSEAFGKVIEVTRELVVDE